MRIAQNEATAALRRIAFECKALDGISPVPLLTFAASDIKIGKTLVEADCDNFATIVEMGGGVYYYELSAAEVDTLGGLSIRTNIANVVTYFREHQVV